MGQILSYKHGEGSVKNVDPRLWDIVQNAIAASPYDAEIRSGAEQRSTRGSNHNSGWAVDVTLIDPKTGQKLPDYQDGTAFAAYEQYAQAARVYQQETYPELDGVFRWGGYFGSKSGLGGYGAADLMHLDITPGMNGAMSQGSWEGGANQALLDAYPGAVTNGGLGGPEGARRVSQYQTALAGSGGLVPPANIPGGAPVPATMSDRVRLAQIGASDVGEGTAANMLSRLFGGSAPNPVSMSDPLAFATGRLRTDIPLPQSRPTGPLANVPLPVPRRSPQPRQPTPEQARAIAAYTPPPIPQPRPTFGVVDSARSPTLFAEGVGIPNEQIPGTDATYSGANRMSTGGLGALLDPRSFSPATPNPLPAPPPTGPTGRGRPVAALPSAPPPTGPANRGQPVAAPVVAPTGPSNRGRPVTTASPTRADPVGAGASFSDLASFGSPAPGITKTTGGIAGTVQLPRDVRPNVPPLPNVPQFIPQTQQVLNPAYRAPVAIDPLALEQAEKALTLGRYVSQAQRSLLDAKAANDALTSVPQFIDQTIQVPNPAFAAVPALPPMLAPVPATQSAALMARRAPPPTAFVYAPGNSRTPVNSLGTDSYAYRKAVQNQRMGGTGSSLSGLTGGANITDADKRLLRAR